MPEKSRREPVPETPSGEGESALRAPDPVLHLRGPIRPGPGGGRAEGGVVDGRTRRRRPALAGGREFHRTGGVVVPGLADLRCRLGVGDGGGGTTLETARQQALTDRDTGVLLIRDAGS